MRMPAQEYVCRTSRRGIFRHLLGCGLCAVALAVLATLPVAAQYPIAVTPASTPGTVVRTGAVPTREALRLSLMAGAGSVNIFTDASGEVRYRVHVEGAAGDPAAVALAAQFQVTAHSTAHGVTLTGEVPGRSDLSRLEVSYEIHVPRLYDLAIVTQAGDIVTQDIVGRVELSTGGGDIRIGKVGDDLGPKFFARLSTGGGHIVVGDVYGALRAVTAGGHITAGNVSGDAELRTGGGHIQVGRITGTAQLYTGGGNINASGAGAGVTAETLGGRIELGTAAGAIHARTGGGGLRIARLAGPTVLASTDGGISLAGVEAPLRVSTPTGSITASFSPLFPSGSGRAEEISELASGQGDILVYLPRKLAVTIEARIEGGSDHRIVSDASFPLRVTHENSATGPVVRGECAVNGGGEVLHLKTAGGNIELRFLDASAEQQDLPAKEGLPVVSVVGVGLASQNDRLEDGSDWAAMRFAVLTRMFDELVWGGVRVAPDEQQKRLIHPIVPVYPEAARQAGIEGEVTLRVLIGRDGAVRGIDAISGEPVLVRAAMHAVEQWRYEPVVLGGAPVNVVSAVTVAFHLR